MNLLDLLKTRLEDYTETKEKVVTGIEQQRKNIEISTKNLELLNRELNGLNAVLNVLADIIDSVKEEDVKEDVENTTE